ncbi:hypothetical protein NLI96_g13175 [Meripilus lineatus]|uniref:Uncharacterized protein n=1 Tax=Meripilus lineatus TaxID=2056292 RepID=A0AAD5UT66_9APHY|nr:hypothetical protein NLI96_g13175 [Physisporinus lineatus]
MLKQHKDNVPHLHETMQDEDFRRGIGFQNSCFASIGPNLYDEMAETLPTIYDRDDDLEVLLDNSVYPAATINMGPQAITSLHFDTKNKANFYIAVTALGDFDSEKGGHLVIKTLKLVIQFPPHSTILFMSSVLEHANIPIAPHETRMSLTQYAAGGLFRWVDNGFQTEASLTGGNPQAKKSLKDSRKDNWTKAVGKLSTVESLEKDQRRLIATLEARWEEEEQRRGQAAGASS